MPNVSPKNRRILSLYQGRRSIRLKGYDYTQPGVYFVTLVTQNRLCLFGEIVNGEMRLSAAGRIVQQEWQRLEKRFDYVHLGAFVVMPNHFHGIVIIEARDVGATHHTLISASSGNDPMPTQASNDQDGSPRRDTPFNQDKP